MNGASLDFGSIDLAEGGGHSDINRFNWRWNKLFVRNQEVLKDKVILDLACNTGRMSYPCLKLGAEKVVGVEARTDLIEKGKRFFADQGLSDRMEFHQADLFDFLAKSKPGDFDVILCLGFLYHTVRQVDFFREMKRLRPETVIIDTSVAKNYFWYGRKSFLRQPPALFLDVENPNKSSDTTDEDGVVFWPSCSLLEKMFNVADYRPERISFDGIKDWSGLSDYKKGIRAAYIAYRN